MTIGIRGWIFCALVGMAEATGAAGSAAAGLPQAQALLTRLIQRAEYIARDGGREKYSYQKRAVVEELNSKSAVVESIEKYYQVILVQGWPFSRLVKIEGRVLSPAELRKEDQREQEFRNKIAGRDLDKMAAHREAGITAELIARYHFEVVGRELVGDRTNFVMEFKPNPSNPEKSVQDRIYNRLAGRIWLDEQDAEISRLDVHLIDDLSLGWFGMLGSLKECHLVLDRQRMPDGVWVNAKQLVQLVGRKLVSSMRFRALEESSNFQRQP